jgi:hypothetical protein
MKTKITFKLIALALLVMPFFNSCKKGEGDPSISLRSRKARLTGEWTIEKYKSESNTAYITDYGTEQEFFSETVEGDKATLLGDWGLVQGSAECNVTFNGDGTFEMVMVYKNLMIYNIIAASISKTTSGTWNFLGGIEEEYKNKERIVLNILKESEIISYSESDASGRESNTRTYANGENIMNWQLTTLKNKEMVMEGTLNSSGLVTVEYNLVGSGSETYSYSSITKGSIKAECKRK